MVIYLVASRVAGYDTVGGGLRDLQNAMIYLATPRPAPNFLNTIGQIHSMNLHLAMWEPGHGVSQNPKSKFVSGTDQWETMELLSKSQEPFKLRILLSYWYFKDTDLDAMLAKYFTEPYPDIFADSGAYSAMTQGGEVNISEYAEWLKRYRHLFKVYANLDIIMNPEGTLRNQHWLEDRGLSPLPAFHVREDWKWLEAYVEKYPYIALGVAGMQNRRKEIMAWLTRCFKIAGKQSVFHGFGLTSWPVISNFPWYSVDSSSWGQGFRFGIVPVFDRFRGRFVKLSLGDRKNWAKYASLVHDLGFDPNDFSDRSRNDRAKICAISALSYMQAERWLRGRFGEIGIPNRQGSTGLRLHLADSNATNLGDADKGIKAYLVDTTKDATDIRKAKGVIDAQENCI